MPIKYIFAERSSRAQFTRMRAEMGVLGDWDMAFGFSISLLLTLA